MSEDLLKSVEAPLTQIFLTCCQAIRLAFM